MGLGYEVYIKELLKPDPFDWADEVEHEHETKSPREIDVVNQLKPDAFDFAEEVGIEIASKAECMQHTLPSSKIDLKGLLRPDAFDWADDVEEYQRTRQNDIDELLKPEYFDWADEVEIDIARKVGRTQKTLPSSETDLEELLQPDTFDRAENVEESRTAHETHIHNLLKPVYFDWAEEVESEIYGGSSVEGPPKPGCLDLIDGVEVNDAPHAPSHSLSLLAESATPDDLRCDGTVDGGEKDNFQFARATAAAYTTTKSSVVPGAIAEEPLLVSSDSCHTRPPLQHSSLEYTVAGHDSSSPRRTEDDTANDEGYEQPQVDGVDLLAENEIAWQGHMTALNPYVHHFNWLGEPVMERSYTSPEVSLFVILTGPKVCLMDVTRSGVVLKEAMRFIDPVLYAGGWDALASYGHEFVEAVTGCVYPFYTDAGRWPQDTRDRDMVEPVCDPTSPSAYRSHPHIPFNGWFSTSAAPVRPQFWDASARMSSDNGRGRCGPRPFQRSPLRQCTFAGRSDEVKSANADKRRVVKGNMQYLAYNKQPTTEEGVHDGSSSDSSQESPPSTGRTTPVSDEEELPADGEAGARATTSSLLSSARYRHLKVGP